jgi:5'-nucleotidase / UDP-sugar diphosphatase
MKRRLALPLTLLLALLALPLRLQAVELTILHTNDTHGHLLPFSYPAVVAAGSTEAQLKERSNIGGIARRATLAHQIRDEVKAQGGTVWMIDAGDWCDGTPFSTEYHGDADIAAMNAAGYDFATVGNHDFNNPLAQLQKMISEAKFPIYCANATMIQGGNPLAQVSTIEQVGPVKVAVFGMTTTDTGTYQAAKEGVTIGDEFETARKMVAELRAKADIVVLISHCGESDDLRLANEVPGIDVIVGGHSHSRLPSGEFVWHSDDLKEYDVNGTVVLQAYQWGGELGRCDLLLEQDPEKHWHVDRYRERLIPVTSATPEDPAVAAVVSKYWDPISGKFEEVVGTAEDDFSSRGDDLAEYNLMDDAIRETMGTDLALGNLGGVRSPLVKGKITAGSLIDMDPFNNTIVTFQIKGSDLKALLEKNTPSVSGIRYRVENRKLIEATVGGQPIQDDKLYTGATNSYFAGRNMKDFTTKDTGTPRIKVLTEYIKKKGTIRPAYDGRRVVVRAAQ